MKKQKEYKQEIINIMNTKEVEMVKKKRSKEGKVKQKVLFYLGNIDNIIKMFIFYKEHNN